MRAASRARSTRTTTPDLRPHPRRRRRADDARTTSALKQIEFVRLEPEKALAVLVGEDGSVENRVVAIPPDISASTLTEAGNYLNAHARGGTLAEARGEIERAREAARGEIDALAARLVDAGLASWAGAAERATATDRARPGQSDRRLARRARTSSASACCSPTSRPRPT